LSGIDALCHKKHVYRKCHYCSYIFVYRTISGRISLFAMFESIKSSFVQLVKETASVSKELLWILIPIIILVKILKESGAITLLGQALAPVMSPLGLPGEIGIVWAAAILTNIYGGIATLMSLGLSEPLNEAQATILGVLILLAHGLPTEIILCRRVAGVWKAFLAMRLLGAWLLRNKRMV